VKLTRIMFAALFIAFLTAPLHAQTLPPGPVLMRQAAAPEVLKPGEAFTLAWDAPTTGTAPTGYTVQIGTSTPVDLPVTTRTYLVAAGVPAGTTMTLSVKAYNLAGPGPASSVMVTTIGPGAPLNLRIIRASTLAMNNRGQLVETLEWARVEQIQQ
jgi:hypothetical protein